MTETFDELSVIGDSLNEEDELSVIGDSLNEEDRVELLASLPESYDMLLTALKKV